MIANSEFFKDCNSLKSFNYYYQYLMKLLILIGLTIVIISALYTSQDFQKLGFKIDGIMDQIKPVLNDISTSCNNVALGQSPYNWNGIVKSGYLNVGPKKGGSALAFVFYGKQNTSIADIKKIPTLIWLNGGPGSSSQLGNYMELGPFWIAPGTDQPWVIKKNNNSWVKQWNIIFVDQPVGSGLAYADPKVIDPYTHSMDDVAQDFYNALHELYYDRNGCFSSLGISPQSDLYIFGQSYAGKYVPAIAAKILKEKQNGGFLTGLRGIGIGDPFTQPYDILAEMGSFAYNLGLMDYQQRSKLQQYMINATFQHRSRDWNQLHNSFSKILNSIVKFSGGVNVYDLTKYQSYPTQIVGEYFNDPDIQNLFGFNSDITFGQQSANVYEALFEDFMKPYVNLVEYCLSKNLPTLIYNGQNDIIVQSPGTMRWVEKLNYKDADQFRNTMFKTWKANNTVAGSIKSAGYLQFRIVNNAGHLVPMDQGYNALQMIKSFTAKYRSYDFKDQ